MKLEYNGSWFRIVVEVFRLPSLLTRRRSSPWRRNEASRRRMLRKVIHKIARTET